MKIIANIWDSFSTESARIELEAPMFTYEDCRLALGAKLGINEPWEHLHSHMDSDGRTLRVALQAEIIPGQVHYSIEEYALA